MNIGIAGNGKIIDLAGEAIVSQPDFHCTAIVCRPGSREKTANYAKKFQIPELYTDYQEFLQTAPIEAVYIGIVNSEHFNYAKQALLAGKHVILEKPFTVTWKEAQELAQLSRKTGAILLEAIYIRYSDWIEKIHYGLEKIGKIRMIQCSFSQFSSRYEEYRKGAVLPVFNPGLAGGALFDLGVYCVHFVDAVMGEEKIQEISYKANHGFNGVDTSGVLTIHYPESLAVCVCAKDSDGERRAVIQGEEGWLEVENFPTAEKVLLHCRGKEKPEILWEKTDTNPNFLMREFGEFARILTTGSREEADKSLTRSLRVMKILDAAMTGR